MRRLILALAALAGIAYAQPQPGQVWASTSTVPSGSCAVTFGYLVQPPGALYTCQNGTWANAVAGVNPAVAVQYATVAAGDTSGLTYANGASGVWATMTGATNTVTTIDGHAFVVGDVGVTRLLIKNDTQAPSGAFNGVYLFTALHTVGTGDIFTRAVDYDTPSDMNNTGAIPVVSGTANATTSWLMTAQVVTVGTTPLTFSQFSYAPQSCAGQAALTGAVTNSAGSCATTLTALTSSQIPAVNLPTPGATCTFTANSTICVATTTATITVPVPAAGYQFCVMNDDNVSTAITLSAIGSSARYENTARTAYGTAGTGTFVSGGAVGDMVCLIGRDSTHYLTPSFKGTWTAN